MASRTTQTVVCFSSTFRLPGVDAPQPAGSYRVDDDEELIEGLSRLAWRRVASFIYLPGIGQHGATHQMVPINRADLDAALEKDKRALSREPNLARAKIGSPNSGSGCGSSLPGPESFFSEDAERAAGCEMALDVESVLDDGVNGQEALG